MTDYAMGINEKSSLIWVTNPIEKEIIVRNSILSITTNNVEESNIINDNDIADIGSLINHAACTFFKKIGLELVEFKPELGIDCWGQVRLTSQFFEKNCKLKDQKGISIEEDLFNLNMNNKQVRNIYEKIMEI